LTKNWPKIEQKEPAPRFFSDVSTPHLSYTLVIFSENDVFFKKKCKITPEKKKVKNKKNALLLTNSKKKHVFKKRFSFRSNLDKNVKVETF